ncbi:MAG: oligosaccharide flippase family protein [Candidatus Campbellbacteria bacterium]|nr:oligosaccharide flippase family protein [Candidatus Campbellbacteria bacterium]
MVRKFLVSVVHKKISELHLASYALTGMFLLSLIMAFARDRLLANIFGAGEILDIYFAAFRIPDIIFALLVSFMSVYALLPFFERKLAESQEKFKEFIDNTFSFFLTMLIIISAAAYILMPAIADIVFKGLDADVRENVIALSRLLLLQPIFLGASSFFSSIAQLKHRFIIFGLSPVLYNLGIILGIIFLNPIFGITGVVYGVVLGAIFHMALVIPFLLSEKSLPRYRPKIKFDSEIIRVIKTSFPRAAVLSANNITLFVLIGIASLLSAGSISVFSFAYNLGQVPLTLIGVSYSVVSFPILSKLFIEGKIDTFIQRLQTALRHIIFWAFPAVAFFVVLRAHIVRIILGSGEFDWYDTRLTAAALAIFSIFIITQSISLLLIRACYASNKTMIPVVSSFLSTIVSVSIGLLFLKIYEANNEISQSIAAAFRILDVPGSEIIILPAAFVIGSVIQMSILLIYINAVYKLISRDVWLAFWKSAIAGGVFGLSAYVVLRLLDGVFDINTFIGVFMNGFIAAIVGIVAWFIILFISRSRELLEFLDTARPVLLWAQSKIKR